MAFSYEYPHVDLQDVNVDWFLKTFKELLADWSAVKKEWNDILADWSGLQEDWKNYQAELNQKFLDFTTNITNEFGEIKLDFSNIQEEFTALKIYVNSEISKIPSLVLKYFKEYVDNGQIGDIIDQEILDGLKAQVEQNKQNIATNTTDIATNTTNISTNTTNISANASAIGSVKTALELTQREVNQVNKTLQAYDLRIRDNTSANNRQDNSIAELESEQGEILADITSIQQKNETQDTRLTALENRPASGQNKFFLIIPRAVTKLEGEYANNANVETHTYSGTIRGLATALENGSIKPTRVTGYNYLIIINCDNSENVTLEEANSEIRALGEYSLKHTTVQTVFVQGCYAPKFLKILEKLNAYISLTINPFFSINNRSWYFTWRKLYYNNGDFTDVVYARWLYRNLYNSMFGGYQPKCYYESPITPILEQYDKNVSECWVGCEIFPTFVKYHIKFLIGSMGNDYFDVHGGTWKSFGLITAADSGAVRADMAVGCTIQIYDRNNRNTQMNHLGRVQFVNFASDGSCDFNVSLSDTTTTILAHSMLIETTTTRFFS